MVFSLANISLTIAPLQKAVNATSVSRAARQYQRMLIVTAFAQLAIIVCGIGHGFAIDARPNDLSEKCLRLLYNLLPNMEINTKIDTQACRNLFWQRVVLEGESWKILSHFQIFLL
jgi:hypothetical protein